MNQICIHCNELQSEHPTLYCTYCAKKYVALIFGALEAEQENRLTHKEARLKKMELELLSLKKEVMEREKRLTGLERELHERLVWSAALDGTPIATSELLLLHKFQLAKSVKLAPEMPGIYLISGIRTLQENLRSTIDHSEPLYVGKAKHIQKRLIHHSRWFWRFEQDYEKLLLFYKLLPGRSERDLLLTEAFYIGIMKPRLNFDKVSNRFIS